MKKKEIEKIRPIFPKVKGGYAAGCAVKIISGEKVLLVDAWKKKTFLRRFAYTKKEWGSFNPTNGIWSGKITKNVIKEDIRLAGEPRPEFKMSEEETKKAKRFLGQEHKWIETWEEAAARKEYEIQSKKRKKQEEKREEALMERCRNIQKLPEEFEQYAKEKLIKKEYLYYKNKTYFSDIFCSACGEKSTIRIKAGIGMTTCMEPVKIKPANRQRGICPVCGTIGEYMPIGRAKSAFRVRKNLYLVQPYKETGTVVRLFEVEKEYHADEKAETSMREIARDFIYGGKIQKDYQKNGWGGNFWSDCNLYGLASIMQPDGEVYKEIRQGTDQKYSALEKYAKRKRECQPHEYLFAYEEMPELEMLEKAGFGKIVDLIVSGRIQPKEGNTPAEKLGIRKERMKLLKKWEGDIETFRMLQMEKESGKIIPDILMDEAKLFKNHKKGILLAVGKAGWIKMANYLNKKANIKEFRYSLTSTEKDRLSQIMILYDDYLEMRETLGYELTPIRLFPKDLKAEHDKLVLERDKKRNDIHKAQKMEQYPKIAENYKKNKKKYAYSDEKYTIRPASSAAEIIEEGRFLHHCVGGDGYLAKHNDGRSMILLLRPIGNEEIPWITVEYDGSIRQWYTAYDKKTKNQEEIDAWLEEYADLQKNGFKRKIKLAAG